MEAYGVCRGTVAGVAKRFVMEGMEAALGRKTQQNRDRKVTGEVEAKNLYDRLFRSTRGKGSMDDANDSGQVD